ncbi:hypothetical protein [Parapedobacter sp. DT-150]|uniref:hypothetical protein n=1 Tax=Parapedobacter sp. DT-150 TaxID=3396162 RepID=UPI003F193585
MSRSFQLSAVGIFLWCIAGGYAKGQAIHFTSQTELGMLPAKRPFMAPSGFTAQTFNGVWLHAFAELGATVGVDAYPDMTLVPLAVGWRGVMHAGDVSPYLGLDVGYGFTWFKKETATQWYDGGLMFNPAIGIRIRSKGKDRFTLSAGYKRQTYSAYEGIPNVEGFTATTPADSSLPPGMAWLRKDTYTLQRMSVRLGIVF